MMYNLNGSLHARFAVLFSNGNIIILNTKIGLIYNLGRIPLRRKNWLTNINCELDAANESLKWQPAFIKHIISSLKRVNEKFLCIKRTGGMGFKEKKKERNDRVLVQLLKKTVVQLFDVLAKKKNTVIKNQKCSKWLLYILLVSYPSEATSRCLHKGFQKNRN